MLRHRLPVLFFATLYLAGCGPRYTITETVTTLPLGDRAVQVVVHEAEVPGLTYLNLHDDENTSVEAALDVMTRQGGRLIELRHTGDRNLTFALNDTLFTVDPNRMFTDVGVDTSLARESVGSVAARMAVRTFADRLFTELGMGSLDVIVTLHNNTDENYSMRSYLSGGAYALEAQFAHWDEDRDPDDFFFTTDLDLYDAFRTEGFNAVLQNNQLATDDGSLSVYAAQQSLPYVNVEAQHGHVDEQVRMLEFLNRLLRPES